MSDFIKLKANNLSAIAMVGMAGNEAFASIAFNSLTNTLDVGGSGVNGLLVSPNPADARGTDLLFRSNISGNTKLVISDLVGKVVFQKDINVQNGDNQIALPSDAFPARGTYFFHFELNGSLVSGKVSF